MKNANRQTAKKRKDHPANWRPMSGSDRDIIRGLLIMLAVVFAAMALGAILILRGG